MPALFFSPVLGFVLASIGLAIYQSSNGWDSEAITSHYLFSAIPFLALGHLFTAIFGFPLHAILRLCNFQNYFSYTAPGIVAAAFVAGTLRFITNGSFFVDLKFFYFALPYTLATALAFYAIIRTAPKI